jgi:predicted ferric reductase
MAERTKRTLLIALIVVTLLPAFLLVSWPSITTVSSVSLWFADTLGYAGIVLLLWVYILGAKSSVGLVFRDLAPVLKIHKWLGKYGVFAIFLHPLLVVLSFGESLLYPFVPHIGTLYERHVTLGRISFWLVVLTWFVSAIIRDRVTFRPWKYLHYLAYISVPFALLHIPDVGSHYMSSEAVKAYFFTLVVVFFIVTVVRLRGFLNLDKVRYEVVSHTQITDTDFVLRLRPLSTAYLSPARGQYIYVKLGYISEDHPFSVLQYDGASHTLSVGYRVFGEYTRVMSRLPVGKTVYVGGPYGAFMQQYADDPRPTVFIAGGIGITPFVDQIIQNSGAKEQWLFAANRYRSTAVLTHEVTPYIGDHLVNIYSQEASELHKGEESGYISPTILHKYLGEDLSHYSYYLCGPAPMMKSMKELLVSFGVANEHIVSEKFGW